MTALRFILLFQGFLTLFVSGGLFFKGASFRNRSMALFVLLFGLEIIYFLYATSTIVSMYPYFSFFYYFPVGFLYGPIFYMHITSLHTGELSLRKPFFHFVPAIVVAVSLLDIYLMDGTDRITYVSENFLNRIMPYNYARAIHTFGYCIATIGFLRKKNKLLIGSEKLYAISVGIIYFLAAGLISFYTLFADGWRQFIYYYLLVNTIVIIIGYFLYSEPKFLTELTKKYLNSGLTNGEMKRISEKISKLMEEKKVFLDRNMSLTNLAQLVEESPHRISQTLSSFMNQSFNDFVNQQRVEHAKNMLADSKFDHFKIEAISIDSGFKNKVTFHKAFFKYTELTPATYRQAFGTSSGKSTE